MQNKVSEILSVAADMESCIPVGDSLTKLIDGLSSDELSEDDLTFVAAASSAPHFEAFRKRFQLDSEK